MCRFSLVLLGFFVAKLPLRMGLSRAMLQGWVAIGWQVSSRPLRAVLVDDVLRCTACLKASTQKQRNPPARTDLGRGDLSMTGFYAWAALAALGFVAVVTLISRPEQMWANAYVLVICLAAGLLSTAVKMFEPNRWLALLLMILIFGIGAAAVAKQLGASP